MRVSQLSPIKIRSTHDDRRFVQDELALPRWDGDKIVEERFYYDPGQQTPQ